MLILIKLNQYLYRKIYYNSIVYTFIQMNSKIIRYRVYAPGHLLFCCAAGWHCLSKICIGKMSVNCCDYGFRNDSQVHTLYNIFSELKSYGATINLIDPKTIQIELPSSIIDLHASLLRNNIPIELLKIVEEYYGQHGSTETILYHMITKMIYNLTKSRQVFRSVTWQLPYSNISNIEFTQTLYWNFGFGVGYYDSNELMLYVLNPDLFYSIYKDVNKLDDTFVIPMKSDCIPPSLCPPLIYNLKV